MYDERFAERLCNLRVQKGISARDMSLSIGQNPGYINNIESGKALPSMSAFFYICDYLEITPKEFFDFDTINPNLMNDVLEDLKRLNDIQLQHVFYIIRDILT